MNHRLKVWDANRYATNQVFKKRVHSGANTEKGEEREKRSADPEVFAFMSHGKKPDSFLGIWKDKEEFY